jgi:hypothetical protein
MNEITFNIEVSDMKAFQRYHRWHSKSYRRMWIALLVLFFGISLNEAIRAEWAEGSRVLLFFVMWGIMLMIFSVYWLIWLVLVQFRTWKDGARHGILGEHTITLTPEALRERTAVNEGTAAWKGIYRIDANASYLFIYLQPEMAHVIPRRAFPTPEAAEEFLATARAYYAAAVAPVSPS